MPHHDLDRYQPLLNADDFAQLRMSITRPLPPALRINTLKIDVEPARRMWPEWYSWQVEPVPFCPSGWQISGNEQNLSRTIEHRMGCYYIQDAASMLPVELFHYEDNQWPLVLDMAASPGGKTTHLACKIGDRGLIIANDSSSGRIAALRSNLQAWGAMSVALTSYPGERFGEWLPEAFDKVLLDAPCSGESLRTAERRKTRPVSAKERTALHRRQVKLLVSAVQALKPGGEVVYATCTLAPEEDEAVLDELLSLYPHQVRLESVTDKLPIAAPALANDGEREFHPKVQRAVRLWPHLYDTSGFFAALIRKTDSISTETQTPPSRPLAAAGFVPLSPGDQNAMIGSLQSTYGFDLGAVLERQRLELWRREKTVYAIPQQYLAHFGDFPCIAIGMLIGDQTGSEFVPSHELVARFGSQFVGQRLRLAAADVTHWLTGQDLRGFNAAPYPVGSVILLEDDRGRYLGRGKVLRERLRNLLPKR